MVEGVLVLFFVTDRTIVIAIVFVIALAGFVEAFFVKQSFCEYVDTTANATDVHKKIIRIWQSMVLQL